MEPFEISRLTAISNRRNLLTSCDVSVSLAPLRETIDNFIA